MRKFLTILSAAALMATPAMAQARGFDSDFSQKVTGPYKLEVVASEDLAHRANNLPKKLSDRGTSSRLRGSFSNNGKYGEKEIENLLEDMEMEITHDFTKRGLTLSDTAPTILRITINEVKPNRPTFNQLSKDPSLSFRSLSIGGADVSAEIISAGGSVVGTAEYDYFSSFNDINIRSNGIWTDTNRAFSRFSKKLSKKLAAVEGTAT
jgi:hypothetical protein